MGQRVFGLTDWYRDGTLAEYVAVEARNLAPLPGDVDFTVGASLPMPGLTAWQGLFVHGHLQSGQTVLAHGAAGVVGSMVTQLAREAGAYVIGTGRVADRQAVLDFGANEFVDLENDALKDVSGVDLVFDIFGGDIAKRSAGLVRAGGALVTIAGPTSRGPPTAWRSTSLSSPIAPNWVSSSSVCGTDDCGRTSAPSRPSMTPSPPSIGPSDARGRQSFAFARENVGRRTVPRSPSARHGSTFRRRSAVASGGAARAGGDGGSWQACLRLN